MSSPLRLILVYGLLSLAAVALGAWVCALSGVATGSWLRNLIVWPVGLVFAGVLTRFAGERTTAVLLILGVVALAASLAGEPQEGVRRWLDAGPLHINVALVVLPLVVVALARLRAWWVWGLAFSALMVLVAQPDASQATALGAALVVLAATAQELKRAARAGLILSTLALVAASWLRPDPLEAVAEVEEIVGLAFAATPVLGGLAVLAVSGAALTPGVLARRTSAAGLALSAYMLASVAVTVLGAFPMPLLGVGMSPVLGFWLGVGLLAAQIRSAPTPASGS